MDKSSLGKTSKQLWTEERKGAFFMFLTFTARSMYFTSKLALDRRPINIFLYFHRTVKAKRPNLALGQLQFKSCPSKNVFSGEFAGNISVGSDGSGL